MAKPNWRAIRALWGANQADILAAGRAEWGSDPYVWDGLIEMTPIEALLWQDIREVDAVFYPQWPVGKFFADFANPFAKVVIECDGAAFHQDKEKDNARDAYMRELGWQVYRIEGKDCVKDFNEETMQASEARKFIQSIAQRHGLIRNAM